MDRNVFLSLLALDAYNRGYGANINGLVESGSIGTAKIRPFCLGEKDGWEAAGFYAIAYDWQGERVISYRGTNFDVDFSTPLAIFSSPAFKDIWNGWGVGGGFTGGSQAALAEDFYKSVAFGQSAATASVFDRSAHAVTLTGHSLGGGLAGYVSSLTGQNSKQGASRHGRNAPSADRSGAFR